jgi:hypothetical protein
MNDIACTVTCSNLFISLLTHPHRFVIILFPYSINDDDDIEIIGCDMTLQILQMTRRLLTKFTTLTHSRGQSI